MAESPDLMPLMQALPIQAPTTSGQANRYRSRRGQARSALYDHRRRAKNIPVVIGTAGGSGAAPHLECAEK